MATIKLRESTKEMKRLKNEPLLLAVIIVSILLTLYFVIWPIIKVVTLPTGKDWLQLFANKSWQRAGLHSLFMTLISTISCTFLAFIFAYTIVRLEVPLKGLFKFITILPLVSPPFIVALSYILLFGVQGIIAKNVLHMRFDVYGWQGLWIVQTITFFPYAYGVLVGVLKSISTNLEYAAFNMGASRWKVFRDVFFPLCRPGIAGAALIAAINVLADFGNPMIIAGNYNVLPTEAYLQIVGWANTSTAAVLATALLLPALLIFIANRYWVGKRSYVTITGKEISLAPYNVPFYVKWGLFAICLIATIFVLAIYGVLIFGAFTKTWGYDWSLTIRNFANVFAKGSQIFNSIKFALISSLLAAFFAMVLAYIVQKKQVGINRFLDFLAILPGAIPGVFLGLGFAMAFNSKPLLLSGTSWIMILALTFWNIPTCYSAYLASLQQIGNSVEEASLNLGANNFVTFKNIILPLLKGPFMSGFVISFLRAVTCLSVVIFIYSAQTAVATVGILSLVNEGMWGSASALTVVLLSIAFAVLGLAEFIMKKQGKSLNL